MRMRKWKEIQVLLQEAMIDIDQQWREFERKVIAKDAPEIQRKEMRRAFFAGFEMSLVALSHASSDEDRAVESLEDMYRQCREFAERVEMGAA